MKSDREIVDELLCQDPDVPVPPEHVARIAAGLARELAASDLPRTDASPPGADVASAAGITGASVAKLVTIGLVALGAGGAGFVIGRSTAPSPPSIPSAAPVSPAASPTVSPSDSASLSASTSASASPSAPSSTASSTAPSASFVPPSVKGASAPIASSPTESAPSFDREQSLLERARNALSRRDGVAAQDALDAAARDFPRSRHAEERAYLQILTYRERGDVAGARDAAQRFITAYPDSLLRARVEPLAK